MFLWVAPSIIHHSECWPRCKRNWTFPWMQTTLIALSAQLPGCSLFGALVIILNTNSPKSLEYYPYGKDVNYNLLSLIYPSNMRWSSDIFSKAYRNPILTNHQQAFMPMQFHMQWIQAATLINLFYPLAFQWNQIWICFLNVAYKRNINFYTTAHRARFKKRKIWF